MKTTIKQLKNEVSSDLQKIRQIDFNDKDYLGLNTNKIITSGDCCGPTDCSDCDCGVS